MALALHSQNLHRGERLTVPGLATRALALAELEDDELRSATVLDDLAFARRASDARLADRHGLTADEQHVIELHLVAGITGQGGDLNHVAGGDSILLSAGADDCVRHGIARGGGK